MRRQRTVVDDASALRVLMAHHAESFLQAKKGAVQVDIDRRLPFLIGQFVGRRGRRADAGIVEQHVETPENFLGLGEQRLHLRGIADVGRKYECLLASRRFLGGAVEHFLAASGQHHRVARVEQGERHRLADAGACARDHGDFRSRSHADLLMSSIFAPNRSAMISSATAKEVLAPLPPVSTTSRISGPGVSIRNGLSAVA